MLSRSFSPSKISRFPPPPPPPSAPPPRNKNYRSHRQRQSTKDNNAAPKDDQRQQQEPPQQQMTARIEQPLELHHVGHCDAIHIDPTVVTASSSDHPNVSDDSSTSGASWKNRLRHIFHRKQQQGQQESYMNHVDVEYYPTGGDEGMNGRHNQRQRDDHSNDRACRAGSTEPPPPFDGILAAGHSSTEYNSNGNHHNDYNDYAQRYQRQRLFTRSKKRKAPFRSAGSNYLNHHIQNQELKIPFHLESDKPQPPPYQLEMSIISSCNNDHNNNKNQTDQKNLHQLPESEKGSNRRVWNNDAPFVTNHHHPSSGDNGVLLANDPVSDFDDSEWTPMDSSYGAAIPLAGWIPKRTRRTIEFTVLLGLAVLIVFFIVEKSVTSSNYNKSNNNNNNNNNIVNQVIDNYNGDDEVFYNSSNNENTTIYDDDDDDGNNVNLR